ncbi:MAG: hypothetical protein QOF33_2714 [Thermomicrobiales bacterium]|nr:hypothetical protein [Thermomicrobiales bacterium]
MPISSAMEIRVIRFCRGARTSSYNRSNSSECSNCALVTSPSCRRPSRAMPRARSSPTSTRIDLSRTRAYLRVSAALVKATPQPQPLWHAVSAQGMVVAGQRVYCIRQSNTNQHVHQAARDQVVRRDRILSRSYAAWRKSLSPSAHAKAEVMAEEQRQLGRPRRSYRGRATAPAASQGGRPSRRPGTATSRGRRPIRTPKSCGSGSAPLRSGVGATGLPPG